MSFFSSWKKDLPAGMVVFLVALPLCLGIALASGVPLFAGIIAGVIGGTVVVLASGSQLGVSGPAAGLVAIVLAAVTELGYEAFLTAVVLAGLIQIALGLLRAGIIAYFFPASVIRGMLAGIGLIIILKQIPHALGYDKDYEGDMDFLQADGETTFSAIAQAWELMSPGAIVVSLVAMVILVLWDRPYMKRHAVFQLVQGPLVAVLAGVFLQKLFTGTSLAISAEHLVKLPVIRNPAELFAELGRPDFGAIAHAGVWLTAATLALIASLETLLCVEATDKLDPHRRMTPTNRELQAQGLGNMLSGLIGGLPLTQVIVRSSANIQSGGESRLAALVHGALLLLSVLLIPGLLNLIPLASLAAILILVGYKLAKPSLFLQEYRHGWRVFVPFLITVVVILLTDLLIGIAVGMGVAVFFILLRHYQTPFVLNEEGEGPDHKLVLRFSEDVSFLHKAGLARALHNIPQDATVVLDGSAARSLDDDIIDVLEDFEHRAREKNIAVETRGMFPSSYLPLLIQKPGKPVPGKSSFLATRDRDPQ